MRSRFLAAAAALVVAAASLDAQSITDRRPVATYSIVARDSATGEIGVAVQSHWFSVGSVVTWAEAGIGAVATQSFIDPSYGPHGLSLMRTGRSAPDALRGLVASDRDSATGEIGVAVQSHWFSVGSVVTWAEAGIGAVATQSFIDPSYGPHGLSLMRTGRSAPDALRGLIASDPDSAVRQVAMIDAQGRVAAFTGKRAIIAAGHHVGKGYSVQANLMEKASVWPAMARAFESAKGDLAERLLQALEAAEREGGDIRGRQSAAIVVVSGTGSNRPWVDRLVDLRVEDHPQPLAELRRLVTLSRLYRRMNEGDEWVTKNDIPRAVAAYDAAIAFLPDSATNGEAVFWTGISLASAGKEREAAPYLARAYRVHPRWAELVPRLPSAGLLPADSALVRRLVAGMKMTRR